MRNALKYSAGLIALYLLVSYSTGSGRTISAAASGGANVIKAFQGRG